MAGDLLDAELNAMARDYYDANACGDCGQLRGQGCDCADGLVPGGEHLTPIVLRTGTT